MGKSWYSDKAEFVSSKVFREQIMLDTIKKGSGALTCLGGLCGGELHLHIIVCRKAIIQNFPQVTCPCSFDFAGTDQMQTKHASDSRMTRGYHLVHRERRFGCVKGCIIGPRQSVCGIPSIRQDFRRTQRLTSPLPFGEHQRAVHNTGTASRSTACRKGEPLCLRLSHSAWVYARIDGTTSKATARSYPRRRNGRRRASASLRTTRSPSRSLSGWASPRPLEP